MYHNCAAVAVVIRCGDEVFLTKRNQNPKIGKLDLAGGFTDPKESAENTCARELWEELRLEIDTKKLKFLMSLPNVYHYKEIDYNTLDLFFEYEVEEKFEVKRFRTPRNF
jgi:ADP-ribose pyrophosphatase YjhB (NUDIX family)